MELKLTKPIIFFDLETTGVNFQTDRIVEISYIKVMPNGSEESRTIRVNPGRPIPAEATAIHHITDEDVANERPFKDIARELARTFQGCDIGGFNSNKFDLPLLQEEFIRAGVDDFDPSRCRLIDVQTIFHKMEQRTLVAAYKFYCDKDLTDAHSANADTRATYEVLKAQLDRYPELQNDMDFLANFSRSARASIWPVALSTTTRDVKFLTSASTRAKPWRKCFVATETIATGYSTATSLPTRSAS